MDRVRPWMAELQTDSRLLWLWWGQHGLALLAVALVAGELQWRLDFSWIWQLGPLFMGAGLLWSVRRTPSAFVRNGHLSLRGSRMIWRRAKNEVLFEGDYGWLWCSSRLVGLSCQGSDGARKTIWLTSRRVGPRAWRWLQQRYRIDRGNTT